MKARIEDYYLSRDNRRRIVIALDENVNFDGQYDELKSKDVDVEIQRWYPKKTDAANRFMWALASKIAQKMHITKNEVYRNAIRELGGVSKFICVQSSEVDSLVEMWEKSGIGWQYETMDSKIPGCTDVILYFGSSVYDTNQMAGLIESLLYEADQLGINTDTPDKEAFWDWLEEQDYHGRVYSGNGKYMEYE